MPTYDYECTKCGAPLRASHGMSEDKPDCPKCGAELKQVFLMAPAVSGVQGGGGLSAGDDACDTGGGCATGACPFMQ